jgi:glycosyltransferase involved in cell wall biosynthesis
MSEAIGIIVPARDAASRTGIALRDWGEHLRKGNRAFSFHVVDDGSTDDTRGTVERMREKHANITLHRHETPRGYGACLRTAMPEVTEPLVAMLSLDYGYKPGDLDLLLKRLDQAVDVFGTQKPVTAATGWRTGHAVPGMWRSVGALYRIGLRIALGFKPEPLAGWLGVRHHWRSWWLWLTMGVPLADVTTGLKVFRREVFDRFPIQSDGDFAHAEVIAKLTFLNALIAEEPLPPRNDAIPGAVFGEFWKVFRDAKFNPPADQIVAASA